VVLPKPESKIPVSDELDSSKTGIFSLQTVTLGGPDGPSPDRYKKPLILLPQTPVKEALLLIEYHLNGTDVLLP
jgi:hypothetical protein